MKPAIALLDLDGVLIRPGGYRAVVRQCMAFLIDRLGLKAAPPDGSIPAMFEAQGISTEWDMVPIGCAIVLDTLAECLGEPLPALDLNGISLWARSVAPVDLSVDYVRTVSQLANLTGMRILPARCLWEAIEKGLAAGLFPHLDHQPFVRELLGNTRAMETSWTMRLVQNFILGDQIYEQTYHLPAEVQTPSLLETLDEPAICPETLARLLALRDQGRVYPCCYTARPNLPPSGSSADPRGYSPEAEIALSKVGLASIPKIGYGSLEWLGEQAGVIADSLLKPVPVQALAAVYAAWTGSEAEGLRWAYRVFSKAAEGEDLSREARELPEELDLHVFEDSPTGIIAGLRAANIFRACGLRVETYCWGILANPFKREALRATGATLFPDTDSAMRAAFGD